MGKDAYSHQLTVFAVLITKQQYWIMSLQIKARTIKDFEMFTEWSGDVIAFKYYLTLTVTL